MDNTHTWPPMLTAQQVANHLQLSERKFEQMVHDGDAPPFVRLGRLRRWRPSDVEAWIAARSETPPRKSARQKSRSNQGGVNAALRPKR